MISRTSVHLPSTGLGNLFEMLGQKLADVAPRSMLQQHQLATNNPPQRLHSIFSREAHD